MSEEEKLHNELEENYEEIVEMLSNGNFLQLNGKAINLTELNEYINAQGREIERLNNKIEEQDNIIKEVREQINKDREKKNYEKDGLMKQAFYCNKTDKLLEILDKVSK